MVVPMTSTQFKTEEERSANTNIRLLFFGKDPTVFEAALKRHDDHVTCVSAVDMTAIRKVFDPNRADEAFDCVLCDMRQTGENDAAQTAMFAHIRLASQERGYKLIVFCSSDDRDTFATLPGVSAVLPSPATPETFLTEIVAATNGPPQSEPAYQSPISYEPAGSPAPEQDAGASSQEEGVSRGVLGVLWTSRIRRLSHDCWTQER